MSKLPLISVITVVRNGRALIEETMASVFEQTFQDREYLVLDGASTDGTAEVIQRQASSLAYFASQPDNGIYDAMNRSLRLARGQYVYFLNAGDRLYDARTLARAAEQLQSGCDFYSGRVRMMSEEGQDLGRHYPEEGPSFAGLWRGCCIAHQASFLRRSLALEIGGFDESLRSAADYELWLRLSRQQCNARFSMDIIAWYRDGGLSSNRKTRVTSNLEGVDILEKHGFISPGWATLLRIIKGHPPTRRRLTRQPKL